MKPPLGLISNQHWIEQRVSDIWAAYSRYKERGMPIPTEWISELQTHIARLRSDISVYNWREFGFDIIEKEIF